LAFRSLFLHGSGGGVGGCLLLYLEAPSFVKSLSFILPRVDHPTIFIGNVSLRQRSRLDFPSLKLLLSGFEAPKVWVQEKNPRVCPRPYLFVSFESLLNRFSFFVRKGSRASPPIFSLLFFLLNLVRFFAIAGTW